MADVEAIRNEMERVDSIRTAVNRLMAVVDTVPDENMRKELQTAAAALEAAALKKDGDLIFTPDAKLVCHTLL